jgi:hypothetical protein
MMASRFLLACTLCLLFACGDDDSTTDGADSLDSVGDDADSSGPPTTADDDGATLDDDSASASSGSADTLGDSSATDPSTGSTGVDPTTDDTGATTGGTIDACNDANPDCPGGLTCRPSACCDGIGFCVDEAAPSCGGFIGEPCPGGTVCVTDFCVADGDGRCVDPEFAAALEAEQPGCWNAG